MDSQFKPSRLIGPEDVSPGDYVTVAHETVELIPLLCDEGWQRQVEPRRITVMPFWAGRPLKVVGLCLPFVLVKDPRGRHYPLDLRRHRLGRLSTKFGKKAFKSIRHSLRSK